MHLANLKLAGEGVYLAEITRTKMNQGKTASKDDVSLLGPVFDKL